MVGEPLVPMTSQNAVTHPLLLWPGQPKHQRSFYSFPDRQFEGSRGSLRLLDPPEWARLDCDLMAWSVRPTSGCTVLGWVVTAFPDDILRHKEYLATFFAADNSLITGVLTIKHAPPARPTQVLAGAYVFFGGSGPWLVHPPATMPLLCAR